MTNAGEQAEATDSDVFTFVPSYNHAPFIEQCLRSIFTQSKSPRKLLVIDDGSKDDSPAIIEKTLKDCPFDSELIVRENRGLCRTLNEGLELSRGEYFAYISSDDVWLPRFLKSRTALLNARPDAVLAYGHAFVIDDDGFIIDRTDFWSNYVDGRAREMLFRPVIPTSASVVYRREFLIGNPWHEGAVLEDYDMYLRLSMIGDFALGEPMVSAWRLHRGNTSADSPLMMDEWLRAQERLAETLEVSSLQLRKNAERIKFASIATLARTGYKREAAARLREVGPAFPLFRRIIMRLRVAMPDGIYKLMQNAKRWRARKRFGRLEI